MSLRGDPQTLKGEMVHEGFNVRTAASFRRSAACIRETVLEQHRTVRGLLGAKAQKEKTLLGDMALHSGFILPERKKEQNWGLFVNEKRRNKNECFLPWKEEELSKPQSHVCHL